MFVIDDIEAEKQSAHQTIPPLTDSYLDALKAEYRAKIAAAEAERALYEQKLHDLDGIARESTSQQILADMATETKATANKEELIASILANAGTPTITIPDTTLAQTLAPNTLYVFTERTNDLKLTLGESLVGKVSEYHCFIIAGATEPTVTYPDGITWNGGNAPTIAANKIYEISILGNVAAFFEVEPATQS